MPYWTRCRNCGHDLELDGGDPEEKCYFCEKSALKKEFIQSGIKEGNMVAPIKVEELHPETREKLGIDKNGGLQPANNTIRPPVPPRPDLTGQTLTKRNLTMHQYYEANAPAILSDGEALGDKTTKRRWGFSQCGYRNFLKRRGLTYNSQYKRRENKTIPPSMENLLTIEWKDFREEPPLPAAAAPLKATAQDIIEALKELETKNHRLPEFPVFDSAWSVLVQEKWLEVYGELARGNNGTKTS